MESFPARSVCVGSTSPVLIGIVSMLTTFGRKATTRDDDRDQSAERTSGPSQP